MPKRIAAFVSMWAALIAAPALADQVVTIYSADGLHDGTPNWYQSQFDAFTKATGIKVQYIEGGSGVVVERVAKEASNPQADVLVTLPPFIQKAASDGLLQSYAPAGADQIASGLKDRNGQYTALVNNYMNFIYDGAALSGPPKSFDELLDAKYKGKIQYSTPGQAGDGTAVMIQVFHAFREQGCGLHLPSKASSEQRRTVVVDRQADRAREQGRVVRRKR
jgi:2-aminoethylphosphonate transport system substrate-binding protein